MIIFYEKLLKTAREQEKIEEAQNEEIIDPEDLLQNGPKQKK